MSSPSAELEKTICTNSLYGATMCSKISTSLYNGDKPRQRNLIESNSISAASGGSDSEVVATECGGCCGSSSDEVDGVATMTAKVSNSNSSSAKNNEFGGVGVGGDWSDRGTVETTVMGSEMKSSELTRVFWWKNCGILYLKISREIWNGF